jgi:2-aminoethylphosphonate-pyruvate transaminase
MASATPFLLTPGPLTTSDATKRAMLRDWGSRDTDFIALNRGVRERLVALTGGVGTHVAVPLQGSGTFAVEAMLGTFVPRTTARTVVPPASRKKLTSIR